MENAAEGESHSPASEDPQNLPLSGSENAAEVIHSSDALTCPLCHLPIPSTMQMLELRKHIRSHCENLAIRLSHHDLRCIRRRSIVHQARLRTAIEYMEEMAQSDTSSKSDTEKLSSSRGCSSYSLLKRNVVNALNKEELMQVSASNELRISLLKSHAHAPDDPTSFEWSQDNPVSSSYLEMGKQSQLRVLEEENMEMLNFLRVNAQDKLDNIIPYNPEEDVHNTPQVTYLSAPKSRKKPCKCTSCKKIKDLIAKATPHTRNSRSAPRRPIESLVFTNPESSRHLADVSASSFHNKYWKQAESTTAILRPEDGITIVTFPDEVPKSTQKDEKQTDSRKENSNDANTEKSSSQSSDDGVFLVERILDKRYHQVQKKWYFFIKWEGYDMSECTWEPEDNLK